MPEVRRSSSLLPLLLLFDKLLEGFALAHAPSDLLYSSL
jgi:hypothetical protein